MTTSSGPPGRPPSSLAEVVDAAAAALDGIAVTDEAEGRVYARGGRRFAVVSGSVLEVRLDGPLATAASRTPGAAESKRGGGWVRFAPEVVDRHATDRASAWFEAAWRHAEE